MASFDEAIPPGKAGQVKATLRTTELQGELARSITLRTNDPERPTATLTLALEVLGSVVLLPQPKITLGTTPGNPQAPKLLVRKDLREKGDLVISELTTSQPWIKAVARAVKSAEAAAQGFPAAQPGDWIVDVSLAEGHPEGFVREKLRFKTGLTVEKEVEVPIFVTVIPSLIVRPREIVLTPVEDRFEGSATVVVSADHASEKPTVEASPKALGVDLVQTGPRQYRVAVSVAADRVGALGPALVTVHLGKQTREIAVVSGTGGAAVAP